MKKILFISLILLQFSTGYSETVHLYQGENCNRRMKDVSLQIFRPEHSNGTAVIVCPGGSYCWLAEDHEGTAVAEWLSDKGYTACVLNYRTIGFHAYFWHNRQSVRGVRHPDMITDLQRAMGWIHDNSEMLSVDGDKIGLIGFSAGGHLVLSEACFFANDFSEMTYNSGKNFFRPAFVAAIYPVVTMKEPYVHKRSRRALLGDDMQHNPVLIDSLSIESHIPDDCPPVFIVNCDDDPTVDWRNSAILDSTLTEKNIPHKYIRYHSGKHGFGACDERGTEECMHWKEEFLQWAEKNPNLSSK